MHKVFCSLTAALADEDSTYLFDGLTLLASIAFDRIILGKENVRYILVHREQKQQQRKRLKCVQIIGYRYFFISIGYYLCFDQFYDTQW